MQEHSCGHIKAVFTGLIVICVQYQLSCEELAERSTELCLLPFPLCKTLAGLEKHFNQWDPLINGEDENLIPGTNVNLLQSAI